MSQREIGRISSTKDGLDRKVLALSSSERAALVNGLYRENFWHDLESRYILFRALSSLEGTSGLDIPTELKQELAYLKSSGMYTFSRVAIQAMNSVIGSGRFNFPQRESFKDAMQVIFVGPKQEFRYNQHMLGVTRTASFLQFLGAETCILDTSFPEEEEMLTKKLREDGKNIWFLSLCNLTNPLGEADYNTIFMLEEKLRDGSSRKDGNDGRRYSGGGNSGGGNGRNGDGGDWVSGGVDIEERDGGRGNGGKRDRGESDNGRPKLIGGGRGAGFNAFELLENTSLDLVVERYGSPVMGDMVFESSYAGPDDKRSNLELFGKIPGIVVRGNGAIKRIGRSKLVSIQSHEDSQKERKFESRIAKSGFNVGDSVYDPSFIDNRLSWKRSIPIDVCAPFAFNAPRHLVPKELPSLKPIHPDDLYYRLNMSKLLSATNSCQRHCRHCQWTAYGKVVHVFDIEKLMPVYGRVLETFPESEIVSFEDDDFLAERGKEGKLIPLIQALKGHESHGTVVYSIETLAQEVQDDALLKSLKDAGFLTLMLGIENHVERALRDIRKLHRDESFSGYIAAPKKLVEEGFYVRASFMVFYPILREHEMVETLDGIMDYMEHDVAVILFPFVIPCSGTEFSSKSHTEKRKAEIKQSEYTLPNGKVVLLDEIVLPEDTTIRAFSQQAVLDTGKVLNEIKGKYGFGKTYPDQLEAMAFLKSTVRQWRAVKTREVSDSQLEELDKRVDSLIAKSSYKSAIQLSMGHAIEHGNADCVERLIAEDNRNPDIVLKSLRQYINFGHPEEIAGAATIYRSLLRVDGNGLLKDRRILDSLVLRSHHKEERVGEACKAAALEYGRR